MIRLLRWKMRIAARSLLPLLFAAPVRVRDVFLVKFAGVLARASVPALVLAFPMVAGYAKALRAGAVAYLQGALAAAMSVFLPVAVGVSLNLVAVKLIPPYRVRELGAALGTLFGAALYALMHLGPRRVSAMTLEQMVKMLEGFSWGYAGISPAWWLAQSVVAGSRGNSRAFWGWMGLCLAVSGTAMMVSFALVTEAFYGGWASSGEVRKKRLRFPAERAGETARRHPAYLLVPGEASSPPVVLGGMRSYADPAVLAIARKELRHVTRDLQELSNGLYVLIMVVVGLIGSRSGANWLRGLGENVPVYASMATMFLVGWGLSSSFGAGAVGREGVNWPVLKSAPVTGTEVVAGKTLGLLPLVVPVVLAAGTVVTVLAGSPPSQTLVTVLFGLIVVPGMLCIEVSAGAILPNFKATNPRDRTSGGVFLLGVFLELLYAGLVALGVYLLPPGCISPGGLRGFPVSPARGILGVMIIAGASLGALVLAPRIAGRMLDERDVAEEIPVPASGKSGR